MARGSDRALAQRGIADGTSTVPGLFDFLGRRARRGLEGEEVAKGLLCTFLLEGLYDLCGEKLS